MDGLMKMWVSFIGIGLLILAYALISLSRYRLKGWLSIIIAIFAYLTLIIAGIIVVFIVFSGPSGA